MYMVTSTDKGMHFREDGSLLEKQQFSSQLQNHRCSEMLEMCRAEQRKKIEKKTKFYQSKRKPHMIRQANSGHSILIYSEYI